MERDPELETGLGPDLERALEHVKVLRLEPGDALVLAFPDHLTMEMAEHLKDKLQREFPGHKAIVLDGGASFNVLRAAECEEFGCTDPNHSSRSVTPDA